MPTCDTGTERETEGDTPTNGDIPDQCKYSLEEGNFLVFRASHVHAIS